MAERKVVFEEAVEDKDYEEGEANEEDGDGCRWHGFGKLTDKEV